MQQLCMFAHLVFGGFEKQLVFRLKQPAYPCIAHAPNAFDCLRCGDQGKAVFPSLRQVLGDGGVRPKIEILDFVQNNNPWCIFISAACDKRIQIPKDELDHRASGMLVHHVELEDVTTMFQVGEKLLPTDTRPIIREGVAENELFELTDGCPYRPA